MRHYAVERINGLPPKKDGACSMWNKDVEVPRLIRLRKAVFAALKGDPPLVKNISLMLRVHVGPVNSREVGDLDNFLTGICDGLQAAHSRTPLQDWCETDCAELHPRNAIAMVDDAEVVAINAAKVIGNESPWYSLELRGE